MCRLALTALALVACVTCVTCLSVGFDSNVPVASADVGVRRSIGVLSNGQVGFEHAVRRQSSVDGNVTPAAPSCAKLPIPPNYNHGDYLNPFEHTMIDTFPSVTVEKSNTDLQKVFDVLQPSGDYTSVASFIQKLAEGRTVKIAVFGGSFTSGWGCFQGGCGCHDKLAGSSACAWSARFTQWLREAFPRANISLRNLARGGTTSSVILAGLGPILRSEAVAGADLVFLDTLVNDAYEFLGPLRDRSRFKLGRTQLDLASASYEKLVRSIRELLPEAAIFALVGGCPHCRTHKSLQLNILRHYGLPFLDWASLVDKWPELWYDPESTAHNGSHNHPGWLTHARIAEALAYTWGISWNDKCSGRVAKRGAKVPTRPITPFWPEEDLASFSVCLKPMSFYSADGAMNMKPKIISGNWKLFSDHPGKPGWIADSPSSIIQFPVNFGAEPRLVVTYLKSYKNLGKVRMSLNGHELVIDGLWDSAFKEKVSQRHTQWFHASQFINQVAEEGLVGFNVTPNSALNLTFEVLETPQRASQKFKLTDVFTC